MSPELLNLRSALTLYDRIEQALRNAGIDPLGPEVVYRSQPGIVMDHTSSLLVGRMLLGWRLLHTNGFPNFPEVRFVAYTEFDDCQVGLSIRRLITESTWEISHNLDEGVVNTGGKLLYGFTIDAEPMLENDDKALNLIFKIARAVVEHDKRTNPPASEVPNAQ